jgi:NAD(P)-dependent dehydrogenase (short-subunit alcohol dehydrogenase family)
MNQTAAVVGVGPGLGSSLAKKFSAEGYDVGIMARSEETLADVERDLRDTAGTVQAYPCDATDPDDVNTAFDDLRNDLGSPSVLIYNAGAYQPGGILEIEPDRFEECWQINCQGGFVTAREVLPSMLENEQGTILFTGATASLRGSEGFSALAVGKFGLRALAQSMAREFGPRGIHVAHVVIDGQIATPTNLEEYPDRDEESFLDPDAIAANYWQLHRQDRSAWTLELDLRPHEEEF